ncbi:MAG TPA: alpha-L-rhamnosidase C-terminal domain-containing protein, partial [Flavisolibacter sp.]|nr:alpha-L-rhamnosidase C-terminal domain-containing protein [Flavisolibacter sp.]
VDCPQRNERQPWLGDRTTGGYGESFVFDNARLYAKWLDDIEEAQTPDGSIPDVAPNFWYYYKDDVTWPATYFTIADMLLTQYGYVKPVISHYSSMKKWLSYMQGRYMKDFILTKDSYGDWCVPPESPELIHSKDSTRITAPELLATANYYHLLQLMKKFAHLAGKDEDINAYSTLAIKIKEAFNTRFFNQNQKLYSNNTVTANLLPLAFDMVPEGEQEPVFKHIADKIVEENKGHISTGVIGTQWLMRMLTRYGCPDIAYKIASNRDYPSWGYMVANGATTIWELWNGNTANPQMNSQNHVMLLGDLIIWMYENIGGIKSDPAQPGFKVMEMKPSFTGLGHAKVSYHSIYGQISSEWKKSGQQLDWNITIPGNTKAIIHLPAIVPSDVMENGNEATSAEGVKFLRMEGANAVFEVGSGKYSFRTKTTLKNT